MDDATKWYEKKLRIIHKFDYHCAYCGCKIGIENFHIDHIVPRLEGGSDKDDNLFPSCSSCNNFKRSHSLETFRSEIELQIMRLRRDKPTFRLAERYGLITCNETKKVKFYFESVQNG